MKKQAKPIYGGLTPNQIKKIVYGEDRPAPTVATLQTKKKAKPTKLKRPTQAHNPAFLFDLPYTTALAATVVPTPDWFTFKSKADVTVVVPLVGGSHAEAIKAWDLGNEGLKVEILYVDDGTAADGVLEAWAARKEHLKQPVGKIIQNSTPQGWVGCCNVGAYHASGEYVVFLNPSAVPTAGWLRPLLRTIKKPEVGVVGGMHLEDGKTFVEAGLSWSWEEQAVLPVGRRVYDGKEINRPFHIDNTPADLFDAGQRDFVSSSLMAVKKSVFAEVGGFAPNLSSAEWADADFCLWLKERGFKVMYQPNSRICRKPAQSLDRNWAQGRSYFLNKWGVSARMDGLVKAKRLGPKPRVEDILVRRRAAHGDVLMAAAVVPALKKKYPGSRVFFCTDIPEVVQGNPHIDKIVTEPSERQFQLYINLDMTYEYRPGQNILTVFCETAGVKKEDCQLHMATEPCGVDLPDTFTVIHAGKTLWVGRNWSPYKFDALCTRLKSEGRFLICVGTMSDHKPANCDLDLRGKTTPGQLADVVRRAELFVGIDSFPMHVAQTFNVPGVCFMGAVKPEVVMNRDSVRAVTAEGLGCLGCHHRKPTPCTATTVCAAGVQDCINNVTVDHFLKAIHGPLPKES